MWTEEHLDQKIRVFAVDNNKRIMELYLETFPDDGYDITDAHQFLLDNLERFEEEGVDFIWVSPPCQSHSKAKYWRYYMGDNKPYYQDFGLYEIIHLLQNQGVWSGNWVVENVIPWYRPLIEPTVQLGRHLFWSNFKIPKIHFSKKRRAYNELGNRELRDIYGLTSTNQQWLRNATRPDVGLYILKCSLGIYANTEAVRSGF